MRAWALRELRSSAGRYASSIAVVAVVSAFAVLLIEAISVAVVVSKRAGMDQGSGAVALGSVGAVFLGVAVVVAVIVVGNTFAAVYAGRIRDIATLRLLGATAKQVRRTALLDGTAVGITGAVVGIAVGIALGFAGLALAAAAAATTLDFEWNAQLLLVPLIGGTVATVLAARTGVRDVALVSPAEAARSLPAGRREPEAVTRRRVVTGTVLIVIGAALLALGAAAGYVTPAGVLVAFVGGVVSIAGVITAAPVILPPVVVLLARVLPATASTRLAAANLRLESVRTARTVLAVTIGVTVLTMFQVAGLMMIRAFRSFAGGAASTAQGEQAVGGLLTVVDVLTSFSVIVAAIGLASTLAISVLHRRRELGVLRAVGFTGGQARRMLLTEGVLVASAGAVVGLLLGIVYGWVGAVSVFGRHVAGPPEISPVFMAAVAVCAITFGAIASVAPGRRASRVPPAVALLDV